MRIPPRRHEVGRVQPPQLLEEQVLDRLPAPGQDANMRLVVVSGRVLGPVDGRHHDVADRDDDVQATAEPWVPEEPHHLVEEALLQRSQYIGAWLNSSSTASR